MQLGERLIVREGARHRLDHNTSKDRQSYHIVLHDAIRYVPNLGMPYHHQNFIAVGKIGIRCLHQGRHQLFFTRAPLQAPVEEGPRLVPWNHLPDNTLGDHPLGPVMQVAEQLTDGRVVWREPRLARFYILVTHDTYAIISGEEK